MPVKYDRKIISGNFHIWNYCKDPKSQQDKLYSRHESVCLVRFSFTPRLQPGDTEGLKAHLTVSTVFWSNQRGKPLETVNGSASTVTTTRLKPDVRKEFKLSKFVPWFCESLSN